MKASEILRGAAENIHNGVTYGCCYAIDNVYLSSVARNVHDWSSARNYFDLFKPDYTLSICFWEFYDVESGVIALLFAAAIAEGEGE